MLRPMNSSTPTLAGRPRRAGSRGRAWLPCVAALAVAAFFIVPVGYGIALVQSGIAGPPCMESCDRPGGGRVWIAIGAIGLALAFGIWRRQLFAVAVAACLGVAAGVILLAFATVTVIGLHAPVVGETAILVGLTAAVGLTVLLLGLVLLDAAEFAAPARLAPDVEET
jgi:hypothetical protein